MNRVGQTWKVDRATERAVRIAEKRTAWKVALALGFLAILILLILIAFNRSPSVSVPAVDGNRTPGAADSSDGTVSGPRRPRQDRNRQSKIVNSKLKSLLDSGAGKPVRPSMTASPVDTGKVSLHLARPHRVVKMCPTVRSRGGEFGDGVPTDYLDPAPPRGKVFVTPMPPKVRVSSARHDPTDHKGRVYPRPPLSVFPAWRDLEYEVLDGIWQIETERGRNRASRQAGLKRGDGGRAAGQIQQHRDHWIRGCEYLGVNWPWPADTRDVDKCFHVARANWYRDHLVYVIAGDVDELIRRFRRPFDPYTKCNDAYLRRVKAAMKQALGTRH